MKQQWYYYGWFIELISSSDGYIFKCWIPEEQAGVSNNHIYPSLSQALQAAKQRIRLESASLAIIQFLNECYRNSLLSFEERKSLAKTIVNFTVSANQPPIKNL